jgi:purine nucleosidase
MPRKIIITTDPGQDEAAAILMALGAPDAFEVLGVVAVAGNVRLDKTLRNARQVLELAGRPDIPVFAGAGRPLQRALVTAEHVHGPEGLDGPVLPAPTMPVEALHGADFIVATLRREPAGTVTICSLSPLTTLALALIAAPDIAPRIAQIVMMAGAYFEGGNITPRAEFNVFVDPQAADVVLRCGAPLTMLPLDITHRMRSTPARLGALRALGNRSGPALAAMLEFSEGFDLRKYGWDGAPLHGPCVPAFMLRPDIFTGRDAHVAVETASELTMGMTVVDFWRVGSAAPNVHFIHDGNADAYYALLTECVGRLP